MKGNRILKETRFSWNTQIKENKEALFLHEAEPQEREYDFNVVPQKRTRSRQVIDKKQQLMESPLLNKLKSFPTKVCHTSTAMISFMDKSRKLAFKNFPATVANNNTMYLKEVMQQPDKERFIEAMVKELRTIQSVDTGKS